MSPTEFLCLLYDMRGPPRGALYRLFLNQLYDADAYPFDLSELIKLPTATRRIALAFLDGCAALPDLRGDTQCEAIIKRLRQAEREDAPKPSDVDEENGSGLSEAALSGDDDSADERSQSDTIVAIRSAPIPTEAAP